LAKHLFRGADLNDHPAFHHGNAVREPQGFLTIVSDKQCGCFGVALKAVEKIDQGLSRRCVESRKRLIEKEEVGIKYESSS
jgi:hypothetical protein